MIPLLKNDGPAFESVLRLACPGKSRILLRIQGQSPAEKNRRPRQSGTGTDNPECETLNNGAEPVYTGNTAGNRSSLE